MGCQQKLEHPMLADKIKTKPKPVAPKSWRDVYRVHRAAETFPMMSPEELKALAADIKQNGLLERVVIIADDKDESPLILDGRNRLDAMELAGLPTLDAGGKLLFHVWTDFDSDCDRYQCGGFGYGEDDTDAAAHRFVMSANAHRRHLTAAQKKEAIKAALKHAPGQSDRAIGKQLLVDHKTIAKQRKEMERTGEIPRLKARLGGDGKERRQPDLRVAARQELFDSPEEA